MLPLCTLSYSGPFIAETTSKINAISLYNAVSSLDLGSLFTLTSSSLVGKGAVGYIGALVAILLSAVFVLVSLFALVAANGPKGPVRNIVNNSIAVLLAAAAAVFFTVFAGNINSVFPDMVSGKLSVGIFVYIFALLLLLALNIVIAVKKPAVKYKEVLIGGLPSEEYFKLKEDGVDIKVIHQMMDEAMDRIAEEEERAKAEKAAKEEKKEEKGE